MYNILGIKFYITGHQTQRLACTGRSPCLLSIKSIKLNGPSDEIPKCVGLWRSRRGTINIPPCSKAINAKYLSTFSSPTPITWWHLYLNFRARVKQYTNHQPVYTSHVSCNGRWYSEQNFDDTSTYVLLFLCLSALCTSIRVTPEVWFKQII